MTRYAFFTLIVTTILTCLCACSKNEDGIIIPNLMKVYYQSDNAPDVEAFGVEASGDNIMVFSVQNNDVRPTLFGKNKGIAVLLLDHDGKKIASLDTLLKKEGFPSNVVKIDENTFYLFWNSADDCTPIQITKNNTNLHFNLFNELSNTTTSSLSGNPDYIMAATMYNDHFLIMGSAQNKYITISEIDSRFTFIQQIHTQKFNAKDLDEIGYSFFFRKIKETYFFCAPWYDGFALKTIGSTDAILFDKNFIIRDFQQPTQTDMLSIVGVSTPQTYIVRMNTNTPYITFNTIKEQAESLDTWDVNKPMFIATNPNDYNTEIIVGTSIAQGVIVKSNRKGSQKQKEFTLGDSYPYQVGGVMWSGDNLIVIGTTDVHYKDRRVFLIKISKEQLTPASL